MSKVLKAVIYVRVSTDDQVDGYSLDMQTKVLRQYAKTNNMTVTKVFREEGESAYQTFNRPRYLEMMDLIQKSPDQVDVVLTHKVDRWHRNEINAYACLSIFLKHGVRYVAVADDIDTAIPGYEPRLAEKIRAAADFIRNLSQETRKGQQAGAENCQHMGGKPPYGFQVDRDTKLLEIDETTAPAVRKIFELYADGYSTSDICGWLEENGYKTSNGNPFKANTLNSILRNEKYRGCYTWDKTQAKNSDGHRNSHAQKEDYIKIEGGCPAIVTEELFCKVQDRLTQNRDMMKRAKPKRYYPFNGVIYCAECGSRMSGNVYHSNGKRYYQYRCSSRCGSKAVKAEVLEESVLNVLRDCLFSASNQSALLNSLNQFSNARRLDHNQQYQQLTSKRHGLLKAQDNLLSIIEKGKSRRTIENRLERKSEELEQVEAKLATLDRNVHTFTESDLSGLRDRFTHYMQSCGNINAKELLKSTIYRIDVSDGDVKVILADGISVDSKIKNTLNKENISMNINSKIVNYELLFLNVNDVQDGMYECSFAKRDANQCGFTDTCILKLPEKVLTQIMEQRQLDWFSLPGTRLNLKVLKSPTGKGNRIMGIEAA
jgi:site-specific DNA recombinase